MWTRIRTQLFPKMDPIVPNPAYSLSKLPKIRTFYDEVPVDPKGGGRNCITMQLCCMVIHSLWQTAPLGDEVCLRDNEVYASYVTT
jgi:hypothetical protein